MLASLPRETMTAIRATVVFFLLTGLVYTLTITGVAQRADYFHGRPSATVNPSTGQPAPYEGDNSAGSNLAPSNQALVDRVSADAAAIRQQDYLGASDQVPVDLVTTD